MNDSMGKSDPRREPSPSPAPCSIGSYEQGAEGCGAAGANRAGRSSYRRLPASGSER